MKRIFWLATYLLCSTSALACDGRPLYTLTNQHGEKIRLILSQDHFLASPAWTPSTEEPPLSVGRAITIALEWAKRAHDRYDGVEFSGISLKEFSCYKSPTYWFYLVDYTPTFDGNEVAGARSFVAVLFDGSVIGPEEVHE